ncbi:MAG: hypothetical protein ACLFVJ_16065 [Persicimonas sp.]
MHRRILLPQSALLAALVALFLLSCGEAIEETEPLDVWCPERIETEASEDDVPFETVQADDGELTPRFEPAEEDFYRMPWPSDARLTADGGVDISDIPNRNNSFVSKYVPELALVKGFSTMPVAYIPFSDDTQPADDALPEPSDTLGEDASVQLINLSEEGCGERVPVEVVWDGEGDEFIDPNTLKIAPVVGATLRPKNTYAFVVTTAFGGESGATARSDSFAAHFNGEGDDAALSESFEPLRRCLPRTSLAPEEVAMATVFTTQAPTDETRLMREVVWREDTPIEPLSGWEEWTEKSTDSYKVYRASMQMPIFQAGEPPYNQDGGLEFDEQGDPIIQRWEAVPMAVTVPADHDGPLDLLVWEDGTGADIESHVGAGQIVGALNQGFAVATFVAQFHEGRGERSFDPQMDTFNYLNPRAGRTVFRQQIAETSYFIRFLEQTLPELDELPEIRTDEVVFGGQSQGSLVGAMAAGVEPRIDAMALNGVGSYLSNTVVWRKDPFDIAALVEQLVDVSRPLDRFHPVLQMAQTGADVVDPHNYARYWAGWDKAPLGTSVFIINGVDDHTTSNTAMNALTNTADVPIIGNPAWEVDPWGVFDVEVLQAPTKRNASSRSCARRTTGTLQSANHGHFTIYRDRGVRDAMVNFWRTAASDSPVIDF